MLRSQTGLEVAGKDSLSFIRFLSLGTVDILSWLFLYVESCPGILKQWIAAARSQGCQRQISPFSDVPTSNASRYLPNVLYGAKLLPPRVLRIQMCFPEFMNKPWLRPRGSASSARLLLSSLHDSHIGPRALLFPSFLPRSVLKSSAWCQEIQRNEQRYKRNKNKQRGKQIQICKESRVWAWRENSSPTQPHRHVFPCKPPSESGSHLHTSLSREHRFFSQII